MIVTYQSLPTIDATLKAAHEAFAAGELQVVVVDNASADGTAQHIRGHYPWVQVIDHGGNFGFARGCNRGFLEVRTPYTLFLNPDAVLDRRSLNELRAFLDSHPRCGVVAPAIRSSNGALQSAGMLLTPSGLIRSALFSKPLPTQRLIEPGGPAFETNWVCGAIFMIRSDLYRNLGMMDPRFFLYFEETDLFRRVGQNQWELWAVAAAVATHAQGASAEQVRGARYHGCLAEFFYPSRFYFLSKHFGLASAFVSESIAFAALCARSLVGRLRGGAPMTIRDRLAGGLFRMPTVRKEK